MTNEEKTLRAFLRALKVASKRYGLHLAWSADGIEIRKLEKNDARPKDFCYSCIIDDVGFGDPTLVAKDLIYDD